MAALNLSMPDDAKEAIVRGKREVGAASTSEFVRRACAVYLQIHRSKKRGGRVLLRDSKGRDSILEIAELETPRTPHDRR